MKKIASFAITGLSFVPFLAYAQFTPVEGILATVQRVLNLIIPILITLGIIYFIWGVIQYVTAKDEDKQKEARSTMIYGIIGLFVIVSIWGLIRFLGATTGVGQGNINCLVPDQYGNLPAGCP